MFDFDELYDCRKFGICEHLRKAGQDIPEHTFRMQLLGRVSYALQVKPQNRDMPEARNRLLNIDKC